MEAAQRQLLERLRELVEFWFSDANLRRDGFMRQKIQADPHGCRLPLFLRLSVRHPRLTKRKTDVDLAVIATFNKVKQLTQDLDLLREASALSPYAQAWLWRGW